MTSRTKFNIIYADPPWQYNDKSTNRGGAERHYRTVDIESLKKLKVSMVAADDCALFMWVTFPLLQESLDLIKAWGFTYKTMAFTWVKRNKIKDSLFWGMGHWTRSNPEICLLAVRGKPKRLGKGVHSVIKSPIQQHSRKPEETRQRIIELLGDIPRLEMFCREAPEGWATWGNECENSVFIPWRK